MRGSLRGLVANKFFYLNCSKESAKIRYILLNSCQETTTKDWKAKIWDLRFTLNVSVHVYKAWRRRWWDGVCVCVCGCFAGDTVGDLFKIKSTLKKLFGCTIIYFLTGKWPQTSPGCLISPRRSVMKCCIKGSDLHSHLTLRQEGQQLLSIAGNSFKTVSGPF